MESLLDDIWLKIFTYLNEKELMSNRAVSHHWNQLVLKHLHHDLTCYVNLKSVDVQFDDLESNEESKQLYSTIDESLVLHMNNFDQLKQELDEVSEFVEKVSIKRVCIKNWLMDVYTLASETLLPAYLAAWHPLLAKLCSILRHITHLRLHHCHLEFEVWQWLIRHCVLESLHVQDCSLHCDDEQMSIEGYSLPESVCISPTPQATLIELFVNDSLLCRCLLSTRILGRFGIYLSPKVMPKN